MSEFKSANSSGYYSPDYGIMYLNKDTGKIWTDSYSDFGHNSYTHYGGNVVNVGNAIADYENGHNCENKYPMTMADIKAFMHGDADMARERMIERYTGYARFDVDEEETEKTPPPKKGGGWRQQLPKFKYLKK